MIRIYRMLSLNFTDLHISPDLDTVTYTLAGLANPQHGWGIRGDSFRCLEALGRMGADTWFQLGDLDLATHLYRTERLRKGGTLAEVTTEIARALMLRPAYLLLDEPAAGLSAEEIVRLGAFVVEIARAGTGVLLVEHHADLIFDICHHVTVLNLGRTLAAGTPAEIRSHREVVNAYLGG